MSTDEVVEEQVEEPEHEEVREEKKPEPKIETDSTVDCPECDLTVRKSRLESHLRKTHKVEWRLTPLEQEKHEVKSPEKVEKPKKKANEEPPAKTKRRWFGYELDD